MTGTPEVTVIIPVWNRPDDLRRCLSALSEQDLPAESYEVLVVDNGSQDETPDVARSFAGVRVTVETQPGSYAARNRGLAEARGRYVAFTDSDCTPSPGWLSSALSAARANPDAAVIAGRVGLADMGDLTGAVDPVCLAYEQTFSFNQSKNARLGRSVTANWLSPIAVLRDAGGFRADLKSGGDFDMARRIQAAGGKIVYAHEMLVYHPARASFSELAAKMRRTIGGSVTAETKRGGKAAWMLICGKRAAHQIREVWRSRELDVPMKIRLSGLLLALMGVAEAEVARLALGGTARRA